MNPRPEPVVVRPAPAAARTGSTTRGAAFRWLADRHLDASYGLARAILRDEQAAEDATHDAFVRAWRHWDELRDHSRFEQWFTRILVNTCRDRLRQGSRLSVRDISDQLRSPGDEIARVDQRQAIGAAIARLSPDHRVVVALRYYRDLPVGEIAAHLGVPAGTVQSRLHYALKHLATVLDRPSNGGHR